MNLLPLIEDTRRLLLLDAIRLGVEPGTVHQLTRDQLPRYLSHKLSPHQIDLKEILALAELRGTLPEVAVALGVEPAEVEFSTNLSPSVEARLAELTSWTLRQLGQWGHSCRSRAPRAYA
jgi:hydrogenase maturation protease